MASTSNLATQQQQAPIYNHLIPQGQLDGKYFSHTTIQGRNIIYLNVNYAHVYLIVLNRNPMVGKMI